MKSLRWRRKVGKRGMVSRGKSSKDVLLSTLPDLFPVPADPQRKGKIICRVTGGEICSDGVILAGGFLFLPLSRDC